MGKNLESMEISWHPGFYGAMEIELISDKGVFEFQREYNLSKEPLRMDLLIIRKLSDTGTKNEIGRIFKKFNIIEYKSPDDGLSIDDYYKTIGYACLYKGLGDQVDQIKAEDLTVSIFRDRYPGKLFQALREEGNIIEEPFSGIYYIKGRGLFDTQIIVTGRLDGNSHRSLRLLSPNVKKSDAEGFIKDAVKLKEPGDRSNVEAVLQVSIAANQRLYDELRRQTGMCDALRNLLKEEIAEEKIKARKEGLEEGREEGRKEGRQEGRKEGRQEGRTEGRREGREEGRQEGQRETLLETINNLMTNMKWTAEQAMEAMGIPAEKWGSYKAKL